MTPAIIAALIQYGIPAALTVGGYIVGWFHHKHVSNKIATTTTK